MAKSESKFYIILLLGALATISPFSIDMYLPGFPAIAADLNTTIDKVQYSLTSYFIGIAIGQLMYGPLLDRFGRRIPLGVGLVIYVLASMVCALTHSVESLIAMRFIQALGGCVSMVAAQALVRDIFPVNKTAQAFSMITLVIAVSPMLAPTVGGYVTATIGWHWVFIILAAITTLILLCSYFFLPAGKGPNPSLSLKPKAVLTNFYLVARHPQFMVYTLAGGLSLAAPFAYIAASPDIFMNTYHVTEQQYGWIFAILACAMIGSTQLNHIFLKFFKSEQIIRLTLLYQVVVSIILVAVTLYSSWSLYGLIFMLFLFLCGQGLIGPNTTALSLAPFEHHAGSAAALLGAWRMSAGAIVSALVSMLHNPSPLPMVGVMAFCASVGLLILISGKAVVRIRARKHDVEEDVSVLI
ncbi:MAG TPA: multidrug effflux MFS transporter [Chryseolinea sp.]|nr:multidrug effflux MFS transporter [Chryseolinea sp.]